MVDPTKRCTGKNAPRIVYPDIPSFIAPVPHCLELPIPTPLKRGQPSSGDNSKSDSEEDIGDPDYSFTDAVEERRPYFPNQKAINDLIRDLGLTMSNAEILTSSSGTCWMKACKSQTRESVTKHFPTSLVAKMGCASATMWATYLRL